MTWHLPLILVQNLHFVILELRIPPEYKSIGAKSGDHETHSTEPIQLIYLDYGEEFLRHPVAWLISHYQGPQFGALKARIAISIVQCLIMQANKEAFKTVDF